MDNCRLAKRCYGPTEALENMRIVVAIFLAFVAASGGSSTAPLPLWDPEWRLIVADGQRSTKFLLIGHEPSSSTNSRSSFMTAPAPQIRGAS